MALPKTGSKAAGGNAHAVVVAALTGNEVASRLTARCETNDAILSLDGGTTDHVRVVAGDAPLELTGLTPFASVYAKNAVEDSNFAKLTVNIW